MPLLSGTKLGVYEILDPIGAGGMGEVYRARDTKLDRDVAIKVLPEEFATDEERLARFEREAKLLASLNHPNIASIYGFEESEGVNALVLELVEGPTLAERIAQGPINVEETIAIAKQIAEALEAGHEAGVIHRDLKPANIKIKEDGTVKVLDYGLAKALEANGTSGSAPDLSQSPTLTKATALGAILGTASYMSPEQAKGRPVDRRTDVWAFGCCLYEALSGRKAFDGETATDAIAAVVQSEPDWQALPSRTPPRLRELLERCLTKDRTERLRDAGDVIYELRATARPTISPPPPTRRHRMAMAAVCLAVFGVVLAYLASSNGVFRSLGPSARSESLPSASFSGAPEFGDRPAIAVLPFNNLSPDPEQAFFADGLAEDLITRLASWRAFPVIARNSSFQYRGGNLNLRHVGAELGARYLVEGSVRRVGERIRVTAQLIDAISAEHVWAETYDRAVTDVFALQDEIGSTIAASLVGDLTRAEGERARQQGTDNLQAWSYYQLGLQHADRYTAEDSMEAARLFERAVQLDPRFASARARLALENWMLVSGDGSVATDAQSANALATARRAVELDPRDPIAHAALSSVYLTAGDSINALHAARQAVDLNPSMPMAWIWYGFAQLLSGNPEECIVATKRAQALNPRQQSAWVYDSLALAYWETGRHAEALEAGRRLVALQPTYLTGHLYVAMSLVSLGKIEEARAAVVEGRRVRPDLSIELMQNYLAVSRPETDARRNAALRKAGLE